jgi:MFS family permease
MLSTISEFKTEIKIFLLLFIVYAYFITGFHSANEGSALALTKAIVDNQKLSIDEYKDLASVDISYYKDHYYSDKDLGRAFLGVPIYAIDKLFGFTSDSQVFFSMELVTAFFSAASVVLLYRFVIFLKGSRGAALILALVYGLATILFSFSKTFFAHPYSAFFSLLGLFALVAGMRVREDNKKHLAKKYLVYSGISFALSVLMEYTNLFVVAIFFIYYFYKSRFKNILFLIIPFLVLTSIIPLYNYSIFGNFFETTYNHHYSYGNIESIYFRADFLKEGLYGLLFSTWRGLFYYSPILLFSLPGFFYWFKDRNDRTLPVALLLSFIAILLFYSATPAWRGGNSYGPRYLISVMPFIVLPMWKIIEKYGKNKVFQVIFIVLFLYSTIFVSAGSFTGPCPAESSTNPFLQQNLPQLISGSLDSYLYQRNKLTLCFMIIIEFFLLWQLLKDFKYKI